MSTQLNYDVIRYIKSQRQSLFENKDIIEYYESMKKKLYEGKTQIYEGKVVSVLDLFNSQPASTIFHGAHEGGLDEHCFNFFVNLVDRCAAKTDVEVKLSIEACAKIAILHDLCKVGLYHWNKKENKYEADKNIQKHHATLSINRCLELDIPLTPEEMSCIRRHMNSWLNKEDIIMETIAEKKWRSKDENAIKCDAVRWADMKDNYPSKGYMIVDEKGMPIDYITHTSKKHANTLLKKNQTLKEVKIV